MTRENFYFSLKILLVLIFLYFCRFWVQLISSLEQKVSFPSKYAWRGHENKKVFLDPAVMDYFED